MAIAPNDWLTLIFRLTLALVMGGVIGWNRQIHRKAAGLRTHMLVSLGAALFVLIPLQIGPDLSPDALSRTIQGVATGIGFLGAGEIFYFSSRAEDRPVVKGLTSAAAIWVSAALGVVAGCGLWQMCLIGGVIILFILVGAKKLEQIVWGRAKANKSRQSG
ncbi:MAG: MgtC/SapB family protein [Leptolyngbyaceae cyanobacterium MO_188.B28]|nr:MgtC/SapB family protein [Leptolyngbyaceae cyanobacterium MO_188.B28]